MRNTGFLAILIGILVLIDIYVFQVVKLISNPLSSKMRIGVFIAYWTVSILAILVILLAPRLPHDNWPRGLRNYLFATVAGLFFAKLLAVVFFLADDLRRVIQWGGTKIFFRHAPAAAGGEGISRSAFLSWLGLAAGGSLFGTLVYGFGNKYRYEIRRVRLSFSNLPDAFRGMRIVHISDIHSGSFTDKEAVERGVKKILEANPDLILFTGDLVNDRASEMDDYMDVFGRLRAPMGVYSTLGNHDYGDYVEWESEAAKRENLERLKAVHGRLGWRLLMNEHVALEKEGEKIALLGIENWSTKARFPKHGRMDLAYPGAGDYPFKILMSHDPSHWDAQVRQQYTDIDLTLAGHTHGMQFGVEIPGFKWSPVQYMYKEWAGLYEEGRQKLYVNRGFGFLGYPGRVGILPEITVIELV